MADMRTAGGVPALFRGYPGRYMLHCHNLEHVDMAMTADVEVR